jgi:hypothetical protein
MSFCQAIAKSTNNQCGNLQRIDNIYCYQHRFYEPPKAKDSINIQNEKLNKENKELKERYNKELNRFRLLEEGHVALLEHIHHENNKQIEKIKDQYLSNQRELSKEYENHLNTLLSDNKCKIYNRNFS